MYICTQQQHCYVFLEKLTPWDQFYDFENIFAENVCVFLLKPRLGFAKI
jgi:hypothetical protein